MDQLTELNTLLIKATEQINSYKTKELYVSAMYIHFIYDSNGCAKHEDMLFR